MGFEERNMRADRVRYGGANGGKIVATQAITEEDLAAIKAEQRKVSIQYARREALSLVVAAGIPFGTPEDMIRAARELAKFVGLEID